MIRYFETEPGRGMSFFLDNSHPRLTDADGIAIQIHWEGSRRKNSSIFDGQIYSCNSFTESGDAVIVGVNKTSYSVYKWARDKKRYIPGTNVIGTCMFVFDEHRDAYVLMQRADSVAFDTGKISGIGGVVDYGDVEMANFGRYIQESVEKEAEEELVMTSDLRAVSLLGFYMELDSLKTEFAYYGEAQVQGIKATENKRIVEVSGNQLADFTRNRMAQMETSTKNHLQHVIGKLASLRQ